ncbi:hypothetical protein AVEN_128930-1, partial [Araneus ventricosus]
MVPATLFRAHASLSRGSSKDSRRVDPPGLWNGRVLSPIRTVWRGPKEEKKE